MEYTLLNEGYIILRNILNKDEIKFAHNCINKSSVNYNNMSFFISKIMLPHINSYLGNKWNICHTKYRVSNNNNSSDAGTFHRDVICLNEWLPIFTCLTYLDSTIMEIIPKSHINNNISYSDALIQYNKKKQVRINPGDLMIFCATILHRGIFTEKTENRRLIQVFDCMQNPEIYNMLTNRIFHIKGDDTYSNLMITLSKSIFLDPILNMIGYFNFSTPYNDKKFTKYCNILGADVLSSEGLRKRLTNKSDPNNNINLYVIEREIRDLPKNLYKDWRYVFYDEKLYKYMGIISLFILIIIYIIIKFILYIGKRKKENTLRKETIINEI